MTLGPCCQPGQQPEQAGTPGVPSRAQYVTARQYISGTSGFESPFDVPLLIRIRPPVEQETRSPWALFLESVFGQRG